MVLANRESRFHDLLAAAAQEYELLRAALEVAADRLNGQEAVHHPDCIDVDTHQAAFTTDLLEALQSECGPFVSDKVPGAGEPTVASLSVLSIGFVSPRLKFKWQPTAPPLTPVGAAMFEDTAAPSPAKPKATSPRGPSMLQDSSDEEAEDEDGDSLEDTFKQEALKSSHLSDPMLHAGINIDAEVAKLQSCLRVLLTGVETFVLNEIRSKLKQPKVRSGQDSQDCEAAPPMAFATHFPISHSDRAVGSLKTSHSDLTCKQGFIGKDLSKHQTNRFLIDLNMTEAIRETAKRKSTGVDLKLCMDDVMTEEERVQKKHPWRQPRCSNIFEHTVNICVILNCLMLGISLDMYPDSFWWYIMHAVLTGVFAFEQTGRLYREGLHGYFFGPTSRWNIFEGVLVLLGVAELILRVCMPPSGDTGSTAQTALRALRVVRVTRLAKLTRATPMKELVHIMRGTVAGMRYLFWASLLMLVPVYGAAVFFRDTVGEQVTTGDPAGADMFRTVPQAFYTVFSCAVARECLDEQGRPIFHLIAHHHHWSHAVVMGMLTLFMEFGLFNVIHALFVEQVLEDARQTKTQAQRVLLSDTQFFARKTRELFELLYEAYVCALPNEPHTEQRSSERWARATNLRYPIELVRMVCSKPEARELLSQLAIAEEDIRSLANVMDIDGDGTIEAVELLEALAAMRGVVGRSDMIHLTFKVDQLHQKFCEAVLDSRLPGVPEAVV